LASAILLLAALVLLVALPKPASAGWVPPNENDPDGKGYFEIVTSADLLAFAKIIQETETDKDASMDAVLKESIDMSDIDWEAITPPSLTNGYSGTFDGGGHTINLKATAVKGNSYWGLFRTVTTGGVVKNLVLFVYVELPNDRVGGVAGILNGGIIENVVVNGSISRVDYGGGIVCLMQGTNSRISNCVNNANIIGNNGDFGGIAAYSLGATNPVIEYCANHGKITNQSSSGPTYTGGLVGNSNALTISNSYNAGEVSTPNYGFVTTTIGTYNNLIGGLAGGAGSTNPAIIKNSFNYGKVTLKNELGAVIFGKTKITDAIAQAIISNDFYLEGSGKMLFGAANASYLADANRYSGSVANGTDGWGSATIKPLNLVFGKTEEGFKSDDLVKLLNAGPDGSGKDGVGRWKKGELFPELAALEAHVPDFDEEEDDNGSGEEPVEIETKDDLLTFAQAVYEGKTHLKAVLTDDIDMSGTEWQAIAPLKYPNQYHGIFDGGGHSLKLSRNAGFEGSSGSIGLFREIGNQGAVVSLDLEVDFKGRGIIGGVAARNYGKIERVTVKGSIESHSDDNNISLYGDIAGGIAAASNGIISHCANYATITTDYRAGGIAGSFGGVMEYSANYGPVYGEGHSASLGTSTINLGGLAGYTSSSTITNCYNAAVVVGRGTAYNGFWYIAGLLGQGGQSAAITNVFNYGFVHHSQSHYAIAGGHQGTEQPLNSINLFYLASSGNSTSGQSKPAADFAPDGNLLDALNDGPGGTIDGEPQWKQGKYYPELADFFVEWKPPVLTGVKAVRTGTESATVTFTSDEDGSYRYAVTDGSVPEDSDYSVWSEELFRDRNTLIALTGLTSGVNYIHIQAKDADGNVSEALARIPPTGVGEIPAEKPGIVASEDIPNNIKYVISEGKSKGKNVELVAPAAITEKMIEGDNNPIVERLEKMGILSAVDDGATPAAVIDEESGVLVANKEALLEANTGEDAVKIESEVIELPILEAKVTDWGATAVAALSAPLGSFADGVNTAGDLVLLKLKRGNMGVTALRRVSRVSDIDHGLYLITDGQGVPISDDVRIEEGGVYLVVVGIGDDSELDWDMRDNLVTDPLYAALGSGGSDSGSGSGGCSAGLPGAFAILAALAAAYRVKRGDEYGVIPARGRGRGPAPELLTFAFTFNFYLIA
jgi:hypothetical protein